MKHDGFTAKEERQKEHTFDNKINQAVQRPRLRPLRRVRDCCFYLRLNQDHTRSEMCWMRSPGIHLSLSSSPVNSENALACMADM